MARQVQSYLCKHLKSDGYTLPITASLPQECGNYSTNAPYGYHHNRRFLSLHEAAHRAPVSVASTYCAMTESRVYRDSFHIEKALSMMEEDAGKKFNPHIFQILKNGMI